MKLGLALETHNAQQDHESHAGEAKDLSPLVGNIIKKSTGNEQTSLQRGREISNYEPLQYDHQEVRRRASQFAIPRLSCLNSGSTEISDAYAGDGIVKNESSLQSSAAFGPREAIDRNHGGTQHDHLHPFEVTTTTRPCETSDLTESNHERPQQQPMTRTWKGLPPRLAQLQTQEYILNLQRQQQIQQHLRERQQCQTSLGKLLEINKSPGTNSSSLGETAGLKGVKSDSPLASNDTLSDLWSTGPDPMYNYLSQHFTPHKTGDKKQSAFLPQGKEKNTWSSSDPENTLAEPAHENSLPIPDNGKEVSPH